MRILSLGFVVLAGLLWGCGGDLQATDPHDPPCEEAEFLYEDELCGATREGLVCQSRGDGQCYARCEADVDCGEGTRCALLGLFNGGDFYCNATVRVCADREDTPCP